VVLIRRATAADAAYIAAIYAPYVRASRASFEEIAPDAAEVERRIVGTGIAYPWLVAEEPGGIVGYASSSAFRTRSAYRWAVETGVYVAAAAHRQGVARRLMEGLIEALTETGFVTVVASITIPNPPSIALHEALGFVQVGQIHGSGYKLGEWADIGYWQRDLAPRQSPPPEPTV